MNREKVRLMTDLAMYEKKNEQMFEINNYFSYDYVVWHMLLAFLRFTVCSLIITALYVIFKADSLFYNINLSGIQSAMLSIFRYYLIGLGIYLLITLILYTIRYKKARNGMLLYSSMLKRLARRFHYIDPKDDREQF